MSSRRAMSTGTNSGNAGMFILCSKILTNNRRGKARFPGRALQGRRRWTILRRMNDIQRRLSNAEIVGRTLPRLLRYVKFWTESDRTVADTPSTPGQWDLARALADELRSMGLADVELTGSCYVIARLPATSGRERAPVVGLMAHMDTASDVSGKDVKPLVHEAYDGKMIALAEGRSIDPAEYRNNFV